MPRGWLLDNVDVRPPEAVLCAEFERLHLKLDLGAEAKKGRLGSKRVKSHLEAEDTPEIMLFDQPAREDTHLERLEEVVDVLSQTLVNSVAACFSAPIDGEGTLEQSGVPAEKSGKRLPQDTVKKLKAWFEAHSNNPYPTKEERLELLKDTGVTSGICSKNCRPPSSLLSC